MFIFIYNVEPPDTVSNLIILPEKRNDGTIYNFSQYATIVKILISVVLENHLKVQKV